MSEKMEKLPMCRICLVEDVRMCIVVNRNLHELYEKLTGIPFVTEDSRPILVCFFCCAKLKQCNRLLKQCLKAEELFAKRMNNDYEHNFLTFQDHLEFSSGFIKSPIEYISIVDECQTESIAIKEELPAVSEILDDIIEPMEEHQSQDLELENCNNSCLDVADIPPHHSESDLEDYVPLTKIKIEVEEEQDISKKKRRARDTKKLKPEILNNSCLDVADIPPHHSESDLEDYVPLTKIKIEVEEEQDISKKKRRARDTKKLKPEILNNSCLDVADIPPHHSESDLEDYVPLTKIKIEVEEEQDISKKKRRARDTKKLKPEILNNSCLDVADIPPHHSESDLEDYVPLTKIKIEVEEEQDISKKKRRARDTKKPRRSSKKRLWLSAPRRKHAKKKKKISVL